MVFMAAGEAMLGGLAAVRAEPFPCLQRRPAILPRRGCACRNAPAGPERVVIKAVDEPSAHPRRLAFRRGSPGDACGTRPEVRIGGPGGRACIRRR
jgi:hypothetical protein